MRNQLYSLILINDPAYLSTIFFKTYFFFLSFFGSYSTIFILKDAYGPDAGGLGTLGPQLQTSWIQNIPNEKRPDSKGPEWDKFVLRVCQVILDNTIGLDGEL
jgi:hypothetical protein